MIETLLPSIVRRRLARMPALVCALDGATPEAAARRIPDVEDALRTFSTPLLRVEETAFRRYAFGPAVPTPRARRLVMAVNRVHVRDEHGERDGGDTVSFLRDDRRDATRLHMEGMEDMLWGLSSRRGVTRDAGALLATALGAMRSFATGEGVVDHGDAMESCRLANIHWNIARTHGPVDPAILPMIGPLRDVSAFPMVWSIRIDGDDVRLRPVIATADPKDMDMMTAMRAMAGAHRVMERARALGLASAEDEA